MSKIVLGKHPDTRIRLEIDQAITGNTSYVSGSPGYGKSTLLGNLAEQFHAAGEGVLVVDIKGDLARDIAARTRQPEDTIYVKMGEIDFGKGNRRYWTLNPFEGHRQSSERLAQIKRSVVESFERMGLAQLDTMANIRKTLTLATDLALTLPDPTYLDLYVIVADESYRKRVMRQARFLNPMTRREWEDLDKADNKTMTPRERRQQTQTTRNRLYTLLNDKEANLAVGRYKSTIQLQEWLDAGKMVLIDLGLPLAHEGGIDLGNMLMAQLLTEIYQRKDTSRTWRIVVDEFHLFVGNPFATIMNELRSLNTFLVVAHQDRGQLSKPELAPLRSAIGSAGLEVRFRQSLEDRVALASLYGLDELDKYLELRQYEAQMTYYSRLAGNRTTELILLNDWWSDPIPGQFEALQAQAQGMTIHRSELLERNRERYWDVLDADANRDSVGTNGNTNTKQKKPQVRPRHQEAAQASGATAEEAEHPPRPGRSRPARAIDRLDDPGSLLPRPPTQDGQ